MKGRCEDSRNWQEMTVLVFGTNYDLMTCSIPYLPNESCLYMLK